MNWGESRKVQMWVGVKNRTDGWKKREIWFKDSFEVRKKIQKLIFRKSRFISETQLVILEL